MAPAKAHESVQLRITLCPHGFQGGIPICVTPAKSPLDRRAGLVDRARIADLHVIVPTGPASTLASLSVAKPEMPLAMLEQIEKPHSSLLSAELTAQPPGFHSEAESSARGSSGFPARWGTLGRHFARC